MCGSGTTKRKAETSRTVQTSISSSPVRRGPLKCLICWRGSLCRNTKTRSGPAWTRTTAAAVAAAMSLARHR